MNEAIVAWMSYPLIVSLMLCYVAGVPTLAQMKQLTRALAKPRLRELCREIGGSMAPIIEIQPKQNGI